MKRLFMTNSMNNHRRKQRVRRFCYGQSSYWKMKLDLSIFPFVVGDWVWILIRSTPKVSLLMQFLYYFTLFFKLVKAGRYSLSNIAVLLRLETVRWFSLQTCQQMWNWEAIKMFWRAGYRLFNGKFLTCMSGPRGMGKFLNNTSSSRKLSPELTEVNFAVPSRTSILDPNNTLIQRVVHPGVINETLDVVEKKTTWCVLMAKK